MPKLKRTETPEPYTPPEPKADAGASIYRDRAGAARGVPLSEGRDNFAAITTHAQSVTKATK